MQERISHKAIGRSIREHYARTKIASFFRSQLYVTHDYHYITRLSLTRSRTVETHHTTPGRPGNHICVKAFAIIIIDYIHPLSGDNTGCFKKG